VRRIVVGCTSLVLALGVALGLALALAGRGALASGEALYHHRRALARMAEGASGARPLVAWLGDSTIVSVGQDTYPRLVGAALAGGEQRVIATPGLNFFDYYFVMGPVLEGAPDLIVLVAHLRMFGANTGTRTFTDLASMIPTSELPAAVMLPLPEQGISVPRLFLLRALRLAPLERAAYVFEGLRSRSPSRGSTCARRGGTIRASTAADSRRCATSSGPRAANSSTSTRRSPRASSATTAATPPRRGRGASRR
jgi:hypothetical protein